jgi:hypothetical protein
MTQAPAPTTVALELWVWDMAEVRYEV